MSLLCICHRGIVIILSTDVLLMWSAAELGSSSAQKYMDKVRARAGLQPVAVSQASIMKERKFEFAFEHTQYTPLPS